MPKMKLIKAERHQYFKFKNIGWFPEAANHSGLAKGGIYLLSGPPAAGKTTMALELMVDLAAHGHKILYITLEQSPGWLKDTVEKRIFPNRRQLRRKLDVSRESGDWKKQLKIASSKIEDGEEEKRVENNLFFESTISGMESLPDFLARQVLPPDAQYSGIEAIVVDSIQGLGTAPTSSKPYARLFEFNRYAKGANIACLLVGHVTKAGRIAGPRSLEHNVDCVLYIRRAMRLRPLFVPKNRFGPERHEPLTFIMNKSGCLEKSKHMAARASAVYGYLSVVARFAEVQALVKLPKFGSRPGIVAPYLPGKKIQQIMGIISGLKDIDISDLTFEINCNIPGGVPYYHTLDLPLAISMLSSYFQLPVPARSVFVGELNLDQRTRPLPEEAQVGQLAESLIERTEPPIERVFIAEEQADTLRNHLTQGQSRIEVHGVSDLASLIREIWPEAE